MKKISFNDCIITYEKGLYTATNEAGEKWESIDGEKWVKTKSNPPQESVTFASPASNVRRVTISNGGIMKDEGFLSDNESDVNKSSLEEYFETKKKESIRNHNVGNSDYSKHKIQPWDIWIEYRLNPFEADIVKRMLRKKDEPGMTPQQARKMDYQKCIHILEELIRQIDEGIEWK